LQHLSHPHYFRNLDLFGKSWRCLSDKNQIFTFKFSYFKSYQFIEINQNKVSKGILTITDKGNTLNLEYGEKQILYKIYKVNSNELTLISLIDNIEINFIRIGAEYNTNTNENKTGL